MDENETTDKIEQDDPFEGIDPETIVWASAEIAGEFVIK